ncbi:zinc finger protein 280C-like isoform X2 [Thalassophryne amazonica]|uniref:zinc finger protein 280C-like isoform X2 n=1 Tax=Thalassophryne amazonica TaxID=390379 RepID=UPI001471697E|nr:zinc finger protein 280C-like isoform X2 [Thalassophryne amazonica]
MSELFMECVEEELEPWQRKAPEVHLIDDDDDDDDEPIFVGVLSTNKKDDKQSPTPQQRISAGRHEIKASAPQGAMGSSPVVLPLSVAGNAVNSTKPNVTPQPVIVNNQDTPTPSQGFIVASNQLASNPEFMASLGKQYPPGTSFTIVPAGQQLFQQVSPATVMPGVVHRPQVQQISNNVVTLSNVQSPAVYSTQSNQLQSNWSKAQSNQSFSVSTKAVSHNAELGKVTAPVENGIIRKKCPRCQLEFLQQEDLKSHMMSCRATLPSVVNIGANKHVMLVSDFYYGRFEGDASKKDMQKTNTTFKCQSCLKVLKNNVRFMNHMKHHLELEKQNSESWESHTTCQHCYRQYLTPFQLQCHIESAHSPIESSTNCKICELAFESEHVLLEHMKDTHKPGEMPYVCQVCNYRSSFFSDVETHFRSVHDNTKDLLCPFCLKVIRSGHMYMQHYMKHQKKGIHRCGKCRLNFLTYREKVEHNNVHKTFRKPKALEGLPPGTKVTIRASFIGKMPTFPNSPDRSGFVSQEMMQCSPKVFPPINLLKSGAGKAKSSLMGVSKAKSETSGARKSKILLNSASRSKVHNLSLKDLRIESGRYTCVECDTRIDDFFSHFPILSNCGACKYRTSCKISIGNHMIRFHNTLPKNRFLKVKNRRNPSTFKCTLMCLNCKLRVKASGGDVMTKHLTERPNHQCRVIHEKGAKTKPQYVIVEHQPIELDAETLGESATEINATPVETVTPGSDTLARIVDQPEKSSVAENQDATSEEMIIEDSSEKELTESSVPSSSSPVPTDAVSDPTDKPMGDSEGVDSKEMLTVAQSPVSLIEPEHQVEEQHLKSE